MCPVDGLGVGSTHVLCGSQTLTEDFNLVKKSLQEEPAAFTLILPFMSTLLLWPPKSKQKNRQDEVERSHQPQPVPQILLPHPATSFTQGFCNEPLLWALSFPILTSFANPSYSWSKAWGKESALLSNTWVVEVFDYLTGFYF